MASQGVGMGRYSSNQQGKTLVGLINMATNQAINLELLELAEVGRKKGLGEDI